MQKIRQSVAISGILSVVLAVLLIQRSLVLKLERKKIEVLRALVQDQPLHRADDILRSRGRVMNDSEASAADFPAVPAGTQVVAYWIEGGIMVRLVHDGEHISNVDISKLEFK